MKSFYFFGFKIVSYTHTNTTMYPRPVTFDLRTVSSIKIVNISPSLNFLQHILAHSKGRTYSAADSGSIFGRGDIFNIYSLERYGMV